MAPFFNALPQSAQAIRDGKRKRRFVLEETDDVDDETGEAGFDAALANSREDQGGPGTGGASAAAGCQNFPASGLEILAGSQQTASLRTQV